MNENVDLDRIGGTGKGPGPKVGPKPKQEPILGTEDWSGIERRLQAIIWIADRGGLYTDSLECVRALASEDAQYDSVLDEIERGFGAEAVTRFRDWIANGFKSKPEKEKCCTDELLERRIRYIDERIGCELDPAAIRYLAAAQKSLVTALAGLLRVMKE